MSDTFGALQDAGAPRAKKRREAPSLSGEQSKRLGSPAPAAAVEVLSQSPACTRHRRLTGAAARRCQSRHLTEIFWRCSTSLLLRLSSNHLARPVRDCRAGPLWTDGQNSLESRERTAACNTCSLYMPHKSMSRPRWRACATLPARCSNLISSLATGGRLGVGVFLALRVVGIPMSHDTRIAGATYKMQQGEAVAVCRVSIRAVVCECVGLVWGIGHCALIGSLAYNIYGV
jgi:hypothetical protein